MSNSERSLNMVVGGNPFPSKTKQKQQQIKEQNRRGIRHDGEVRREIKAHIRKRGKQLDKGGECVIGKMYPMVATPHVKMMDKRGVTQDSGGQEVQ